MQSKSFIKTITRNAFSSDNSRGAIEIVNGSSIEIGSCLNEKDCSKIFPVPYGRSPSAAVGHEAVKLYKISSRSGSSPAPTGRLEQHRRNIHIISLKDRILRKILEHQFNNDSKFVRKLKPDDVPLLESTFEN